MHVSHGAHNMVSVRVNDILSVSSIILHKNNGRKVSSVHSVLEKTKIYEIQLKRGLLIANERPPLSLNLI